MAEITLRVAGQPSWPMHMHGPALGNWGVGQSPGRAPYGKCVGFLSFFLSFFFLRLPKQKKKGKRRKEKKTLEIGSYKVNDYKRNKDQQTALAPKAQRQILIGR